MVKPAISPCLTLSDNRKIPAIGYGTYKLPKEQASDLITFALTEAGYRHIDTAWFYQNEKEIGSAVRSILASGQLKRDEIWITSKVWNDSHERAQVMSACRASLANLGLDYLDLYLIHWPTGMKDNTTFSDVDYLETWKGMEDVYKAGLAKSIGVSNFTINQLERLLANCTIKPVTNQVEVHPYLNNGQLIDYCKSNNILITCYCPLGAPGRSSAKSGDPDLSKEPILNQIGTKYDKTWAQIALRYNYQRGCAIIPKSATKQRIIQNISIFDFELTSDEMEAIKGLDKNFRTVWFESVKGHVFYPFE